MNGNQYALAVYLTLWVRDSRSLRCLSLYLAAADCAFYYVPHHTSSTSTPCDCSWAARAAGIITDQQQSHANLLHSMDQPGRRNIDHWVHDSILRLTRGTASRILETVGEFFPIFLLQKFHSPPLVVLNRRLSTGCSFFSSGYEIPTCTLPPILSVSAFKCPSVCPVLLFCGLV